MNPPFRLNIAAYASPRRIFLASMLSMFAVVAAACSTVQENNTYPVDVFTEMHYAQFLRAQEPPRLLPVGETVVYQPVGDPDEMLAVAEFQRREYDPAVAAELYSVNCSVCHGVNGTGDGPATSHLTSTQSYYATVTGNTYGSPPNLVELRSQRNEQIWFNIIDSGVVVMPEFGKLMPEEDIWDIVTYLFDEETGLGTAQ